MAARTYPGSDTLLKTLRCALGFLSEYSGVNSFLLQHGVLLF